jgi:DNA-directed RNA polymerase specialized sigma subunit
MTTTYQTSTGIITLLKLVYHIAGKFRARYPELDYQDLVQEGCCAMLVACHNITKGKVTHPRSYIYRCVYNAMMQMAAKEGLIILAKQKIYPKHEFFSELDEIPDSSIDED